VKDYGGRPFTKMLRIISSDVIYVIGLVNLIEGMRLT
jgi:hypothetical protein